jgi:hypothetical protein
MNRFHGTIAGGTFGVVISVVAILFHVDLFYLTFCLPGILVTWLLAMVLEVPSPGPTIWDYVLMIPFVVVTAAAWAALGLVIDSFAHLARKLSN